MSFAVRTSGHAGSRRVLSWVTALLVCAAATTFLTSCKPETPGAGDGKSGPDLSSPKKAALTFAKAVNADDLDAARKAATGTDDQFAVLKDVIDTNAAVKRYNAAVGKKLGDAAKVNTMMFDFVAYVEKTEEKIDGDKAALVEKDKPDAKHPMKLKKEGENWKVDLDSLPEWDSHESSKTRIEGINAVIQNVDAGKYTTVKEARAAIGGALMHMRPDQVVQ